MMTKEDGVRYLTDTIAKFVGKFKDKGIYLKPVVEKEKFYLMM